MRVSCHCPRHTRATSFCEPKSFNVQDVETTHDRKAVMRNARSHPSPDTCRAVALPCGAARPRGWERRGPAVASRLTPPLTATRGLTRPVTLSPGGWKPC